MVGAVTDAVTAPLDPVAAGLILAAVLIVAGTVLVGCLSAAGLYLYSRRERTPDAPASIDPTVLAAFADYVGQAPPAPLVNAVATAIGGEWDTAFRALRQEWADERAQLEADYQRWERKRKQARAEIQRAEEAGAVAAQDGSGQPISEADELAAARASARAQGRI